LLIVDAVYAGLGRTGELWPGAEYADVLVIGKALGHGLPISAALFYRDDPLLSSKPIKARKPRRPALARA
jgi:acetylornithine/succinyldiaminopimelate/putrescine aminotransferase